MNDRVAPFLGGAAFIAMRAQKKLGKDKPIFAIPISIKYSQSYGLRIRDRKHVVQLESQLQLEAADDMTLRRRMRRIGLQTLARNLRHRGFAAPVTEGTESAEALATVLNDSAIQIIQTLEQKIGLKPKEGQTPTDRVRSVRSSIHQIRIDESKQIDHRAATTWADEAILAMRILSYSGDYLSQSPTLDRHSETLEKLREDLVEKIVLPNGDRRSCCSIFRTRQSRRPSRRQELSTDAK